MYADLLHQFNIGRRECIGIAAGEIDGAEGAPIGGQRHTTDCLDRLFAQETQNVVTKSIEILAARDEYLAAREALAGGRAVERNGDFGFSDGGSSRQIEIMNFQEAGGGVEQRQAGVIVLKNGFDRGNDTFKNGGGIAGADQEIVDFEEDLQTVAFARQLLLVGFRGFEIQGVIHRHCHLRGHAPHELDFSFADALRDVTSKNHGAQPMMGGCQRKNRRGMHTDGLQLFHEVGIARVF